MIRVEVVHSPVPRRVDIVELELVDGASVAQALTAWLVTPQGLQSGLDLPSLTAQVGVWGRRVTLETVLRDADRLEVYRPLQCDPKESRRRRQQLAAAGRRSGRRSPTDPAAGSAC
jgi:putative ubiquitin-RnfH superfamily antitoxin RatB of RatAB toxin-antitoxin module